MVSGSDLRRLRVAVGIGLILGAFVGSAAVAGAFPVLLLLGFLLVLAWKTAGYIGLDRWLLPVLGTPWQGAADRRRLEAG